MHRHRDIHFVRVPALALALALALACFPTVAGSTEPIAPGPALELIETFTADEIPGLSHPYTVDLGPDGLLYVVNAGADDLLVLDQDGTVVRRIGEPGSDEGQLDFHRLDGQDAVGGIAVAPDGTIYVADSTNFRVQAFDPDGAFLRAWGNFGNGDGQFLDPVGVAVGPEGDVYVVDDNADRIQVFAADGGYQRTIGSRGGEPGQMLATGFIEVLADGTLVNADYGNQRVQAWDAEDALTWTLGAGSGDATFDEPADVAVDRHGNLWVADATGVQVFDASLDRIAAWRSDAAVLNIELTDDGTAWVTQPYAERLLKLAIVLAEPAE